jgi:hypothetical protein
MEVEDPQYKTADGCALRMYRDTARNEFLSEQEGRPMYDDVIYVEIISPGSRDSTPVFELVRYLNPESGLEEPLYGIKYNELKQYVDMFIKDDEIDSSLSGTPLKQWPEMSRTMISTLRAQNIYTVDALAALPDTKLNVVGPDGRTWRTKAQAYIAAAKDSAHATKLAADLERAQDDVKVRDEQIKELSERLTRMEATLNQTSHGKHEPEKNDKPGDTGNKSGGKGKLDNIV